MAIVPTAPESSDARKPWAAGKVLAAAASSSWPNLGRPRREIHRCAIAPLTPNPNQPTAASHESSHRGLGPAGGEFRRAGDPHKPSSLRPVSIGNPRTHCHTRSAPYPRQKNRAWGRIKQLGGRCKDRNGRLISRGPAFSIELTGPKVTDTDLIPLRQLRTISYFSLDLSGTSITSAGLKYVADLPNLSTLKLSGTKIRRRQPEAPGKIVETAAAQSGRHRGDGCGPGQSPRVERRANCSRTTAAAATASTMKKIATRVPSTGYIAKTTCGRNRRRKR